jgi:hypothetical protein
MGALEILIAPSNGLFSSSRRKIDPETDTAQTSKAARTVALRGANNPKLRKMMATQKISTASNTGGIGSAQKIANLLGFGPVVRHDAIEQDNVCGSLLDVTPHVVEGIGCESDQQAKYQGRQRRHHAHA